LTDRRALIGPLLIGLSVWCAAGQLTVLTPDAAAVRLVVPAPWWTFFLATLAAALVPAWRRDARLALPALLATLPWWPVPVPAIALIWTGPLAWAPILVSLAAALGTAPLAAVGRLAGADDCRRAHWIAGAVTLVAGLAVVWAVAPRLPGGDEPHYLAIAQSLERHGSLRVETAYHDPDFVAAFGNLAPDFIARGRDRQIYSVHAPGVAVLVLPGFAMAGYRGAQAVVLLLGVLTSALIWRIGWRMTEDVHAAWFAWAAVVGSATFLLQTVTVFPDGPGALAVAAALLLVLKLARQPTSVGDRALVVVSALLAALPWLHTRFVILATGFGLLIVWQLLADLSRPVRSRVARVVTFLTTPAISAVGWLAFFQIIYGTLSPAAPYGGGAGTSVRFVPGGLAALLFDEQFGLLTYAPVLIVAAIGLWRLTGARTERAALAAVAVATTYLATVTTYWMWWAGRPATPARFAMAILPALAPLLAIGWTRVSARTRQALVALLGVSVALAVLVVFVDRGGLAWNDRDAEARWLVWLGPVVNLRRGWPSFFWALSTADLTSEIPFVLHAVVGLGVFVCGWAALGARSVHRSWTSAEWCVAIAAWLLVSVMAAVQAGWWMTGVGSLDPARSQLTVLTAMGHRSIVQLGSFGWRSIADPSRAVTIRTEDVGRTDGSGPLMRLSSVPAGSYELRFRTRRPRRAEALVRLGASARPLRTLDLLPLSEQSFVVSLPAGATDLTIDQDAALVAAGGRVDLVPLFVRPNGATVARAVARYGSTEVFFLDDGVFAEADGFWVRGGQTTDVVLAVGAGGGVHLVVRNGAASNTVALDAGAFHTRLALQPSEERRVEIPVGDATGVTPLRIASASGFRPSETSASRDARFLGVWLAIQ
jgi:hypothetical protein